MKRRAFLLSPLLTLVGGPRGAFADTPASADLEQQDLRLEGDPRIARRSLLLVPKHLPKPEKPALLLLLHGLGETGNERLGIHAWGDLYGLVRAYERLRRPPLRRTLERRPYFTEARQAELNRTLAAEPFRGLVMACPVTPNPYRAGPQSLDRYADWIEKTLVPAVRERAGLEKNTKIGLDGCSLGGYVALEVFLRKPELFTTLGGVQSAFSVPAALRYADALAKTMQKVGPRRVHIETSSGDPYRKANETLSRKLTDLGVKNDLVVPAGPHDQPWLREIGTLEMLLWHERALGAKSRG
jgi:pimeloyl-ACP methyl ester carboxylesterase